MPPRFADIIRTLSEEDITFTRHARGRMSEAGLDEELVRRKLTDERTLLYEEWQERKGTFKLVYRLSSRYSLVIAVAPKEGHMRVATAYKTSKRMSRLLRHGIAYIQKEFKEDGGRIN